MSKSTQDRGPPRKQIVRLIEELGRTRGRHEVFSDFVEMAAISISNAVDRPQFEQREARYMEIVKRYEHDEVQQFPKMLGALVEAMEEGFDDVLGGVFSELELHNKEAGQFFTPMSVCRLMARITIGDSDPKQIIEKNGFIRCSEPAVGGGATVIALAEALHQSGINYQQHLHVTAVDVDLRCVHMAYLQFSLLHIPAVIIHGNSISLEEWSRWYTPAHIIGGWNWRLNRQEVTKAAVEAEPETPAIVPTIKPGQLELF